MWNSILMYYWIWLNIFLNIYLQWLYYSILKETKSNFLPFPWAPELTKISPLKLTARSFVESGQPQHSCQHPDERVIQMIFFRCHWKLESPRCVPSQSSAASRRVETDNHEDPASSRHQQTPSCLKTWQSTDSDAWLSATAANSTGELSKKYCPDISRHELSRKFSRQCV